MPRGCIKTISSRKALDEVQESIISSDGCFKNASVLTKSYLPKNFPHRSDQIKQMAESIFPVLSERRGQNVIIYGESGLGKTDVTKWFLNELVSRAEKLKSPVMTCYVDYRKLQGPYECIVSFCRQIGITENIPEKRGISISDLFSRFEKGLKLKNGILVVAIDGINKCIEEERGIDFLYKLVNTKKIIIIGIANGIFPRGILDSETANSFSPTEVFFPRYEPDELADILRIRAEEAFTKEVSMKDGLLKHLVGMVVRDFRGNALRAIDLLRLSAEEAIRRNTGTGNTKNNGTNSEKDFITEEDLITARNRIQSDALRDVIKSLGQQKSLLIISIWALWIEYPFRRNFTSKEVYESYRRFCSQGLCGGVQALTIRSVSEFLREMEEVGIVNYRVESKGRKGRGGVVVPAIDYAFLKQVLIGNEEGETCLGSCFDLAEEPLRKQAKNIVKNMRK